MMPLHNYEQGQEELFHRYRRNPILTAGDWPYRVSSVFNAGATLLEDGTTLLLCRVEDRRGHSHLCAARSPNGVDRWRVDPNPTLLPDPESYPEETWGIEDPRITYVPELGQYAVAYTSYSPASPAVSLALTKDFRSFERYGVIIPPEDKDAAMLPRRIGGRWVLIHRPVISALGAHMWISYSPDLRHWGGHKLMLPARRGSWWDSAKVGLGPPPIETPAGWLVLYHGVRLTASGAMYRLGLAMFDLEEPERCIRRGDVWVFGPEEPYERFGDVDNAIFPCGWIAEGEQIRLYYGAADTCVALATGRTPELLAWLEQHGRSLGADVERPPFRYDTWLPDESRDRRLRLESS